MLSSPHQLWGQVSGDESISILETPGTLADKIVAEQLAVKELQEREGVAASGAIPGWEETPPPGLYFL